MKFFIFVFLTFLINVQSFSGDREGNGGDPKRVAYAYFYYQTISSNPTLKDVLPTPDKLNTVFTASEDDFGELLSPLKTDPGSLKIFKQSMLALSKFYRELHADKKYLDADEFNKDLSSLLGSFKLIVSMDKDQQRLIRNVQFEVLDAKLQDIYGQPVCSTYSKDQNIVTINKGCVFGESQVLIRLTLIHELFRVIQENDDDYYNMWIFEISGYNF